jgi:hypothetical protein
MVRTLRCFSLGLFSLTLVVEVGGIIRVQAVGLAGNGLEEGGAAGAGRAQDYEHLALVDNAIKVAQDINTALSVAEGATNNAGEGEPDVGDILLVISGLAEAEDIEVLEGDARGAELSAGRLDRVDDGLCPGASAEVRRAGVQGRVAILAGSDKRVGARRHIGALGRVLAGKGLDERSTALHLRVLIFISDVLGGLVALLGGCGLLGVRGGVAAGYLGEGGGASGCVVVGVVVVVGGGCASGLRRTVVVCGNATDAGDRHVRQ